MQTGRILRLIVAAVCVSVVVLLLSVWLLVDPNAYAAQLAAAVKEATGRNLLLQGNISLAPLVMREFIPCLGWAIPRINDPHARRCHSICTGRSWWECCGWPIWKSPRRTSR